MSGTMASGGATGRQERSVWGSALCAAAVLAATLPTLAQPPASQPGPAAKPVTNAAAQAAVAKAIAFLYSKQDRQGYFPNPHSREYVGGGEALATLALLSAGESHDNDKLKQTLQILNAIQPGLTYTRALRAMVYSHLPGREYGRRLSEDVQWLTKQQRRSGGWGYGPRSAMTRLRPEWVDASNTQFALLALREASDAGMVISTQALRQAEFFWRKFQNADGGWGYQPKVDRQPAQRPGSHGSMTAAGLASYFIFADKLAADQRRSADRLLFADKIGPATQWLTANYEVEAVPKYVWVAQPSQLYYYLWCLQRAGDAAGLWTFGHSDYSAQIAGVLLANQQANGSWNGSIIDTSFALLGLLKARAPVVIGRFEPGKGPGPNPRDAANLARWLTRRWRRPVCWRELRANQLGRLAACPLLYVNLDGKAGPPRSLAAALPGYVSRGGTVLIQADGQSARPIGDAVGRLLGEQKPQRLGDDHPAFALDFPIKAARPEVLALGDAARTRVFILTEDASEAWHRGEFRSRPEAFGLGGNIVLYACGGKVPAGKFVVRRREVPPPPARRHITIARLKHRGDFDVCPAAERRLSNALAHSLSLGLKQLQPVTAAKQIDPGIVVLWLTGNTPPKFSVNEKFNIRQYLNAGGTLLVDPAVGGAAFRDAALALLKNLFEVDEVGQLDPTEPLITGRFADGVGADLRKLALLRSPGKPVPARLYAGKIHGRAAAVLSHYGLTCSIEASPAVANDGYVTEDATKVALNVILYAASQARQPKADASP